MSLPSIERWTRRLTRRLHLHLGDSRVDAELLSAWKARRHHGARRQFDAAAGLDAAIDAAAAGLEALRDEIGPLRGLGCDVVVADRWLLYETVAIDVTEHSTAGVHGVVSAALADIAGAPAETLDVRWQWQPGGRHVLTMAMARASLTRLQAVLAQHGVTGRSVTGEFVACFNGSRALLGAPRVAFAVARGAGAQVALMNDGAIHSMAFAARCARPLDVVRLALSSMRARGEDTTAELDYVIDAGEARDAFRTPAPAVHGRWTVLDAGDPASLHGHALAS